MKRNKPTYLYQSENSVVSLDAKPFFLGLLLTTKKYWADQYCWRQGKADSSWSTNSMYFRCLSITAFISILFSRRLSNVTFILQEAIIFKTQCKRGLKSFPNYRTHQNVHSQLTNSVNKFSLQPCSLTIFFSKCNLYVFPISSADVWASLNDFLLFQSRHNIVTLMQRETTLILK